jgi:hypothetical protein
MKALITLTVIIACLLCITASGQITEFENFTIEQGELIYQRVFDTAIYIDNARDFYLSRPKIKNIQIYDDFILGDFENERIDTKNYGKRWGNTPILFNNYSFSGRVKVEFKADRYRLTVFGVKMISLNARLFTDSDLSNDALKKNRAEIRPSYAKENMLGLFGAFFMDAFSIKKAAKSDW